MRSATEQVAALEDLLGRIKANRSPEPLRLSFAAAPPARAAREMASPVPITAPPVSDDSPEIVVDETPLSIPPEPSPPPPAVEAGQRSEKATTPGMPTVKPPPEEAPVAPPAELRAAPAPIEAPPTPATPRRAEVMDAVASEPEPPTAPRPPLPGEARAAARPPYLPEADESLAPSTQASAQPPTSAPARRPPPLPERAAAPVQAPPMEVEEEEVELTPEPPPAPAPAIEQAARAGTLKLTPVAITPVRLSASKVAEFIGEVGHAEPVSFGAALDATLALGFG